MIDYLVDLARRSRPSPDGPAGQGRLLGQRDQARAGRRPGRLPGVHAQGPHRRVLPRLRAQAAGRARCDLPAVRHPQRAHARRDLRAWPATLPTRGQYEFQCLHGMGEPLYAAGRRPGRGRQARPALPHLRAGRHARDLLAYLVRRLLENGANTSFVNRIADATSPSTSWSPIRSRRVERWPRGRRARHAASAHPAAARHLYGRERAQFDAASIWPNEHALRDARPRAAARARRAQWRAAPLLGERERATRHRAAGARTRPIAATWSARSSKRRAPTSTARSTRPQRAAPRWDATPAAERAAMLERAADAAGSRMPRADRPAGRAKPARPAPTRSPKCARRSTSCATTRRRRARDFATPAASAARPGGLHQPVELPAGDLRRPGRRGARRRQRRARQAGRADAADRRRGGAHCCTRPACRAARCSCCRAAARPSAPRWSPTRASRGVLFTGSTEVARAAAAALAGRARRDGGRCR